MSLSINLELKPQLTVITSVFNDAKFLAKTIESVRYQSDISLEYIVVDGGSTDGTLEILNTYRDQIDFIISEPDKGIYDAWNKAIKLAHGEWIAFLGAGDTYHQDAVSTYLNMIETSGSKHDLISSRVRLVDSCGTCLRVRGVPFIWNEFKKAMEFAHVGAFHHRSLFERFGLFDISYKSAGDYDFFMRCGKDLRTLFINTVTADVLTGGISMDSSIGLQETHSIQIKYGMNPITAEYRYYIARLKQKFRPLLRGY